MILLLHQNIYLDLFSFGSIVANGYVYDLVRGLNN
jgi:hypothetical protein